MLPLHAQAQGGMGHGQADVPPRFAPLLREAAAAVVTIHARRAPFAGDGFIARFVPEIDRPELQVPNALGSGVILAPDGVVVTTRDVVGRGSDFRVVLSDRREVDAGVVLADAASDLAILRLDTAREFPGLSLGDSDAVVPGAPVLAIGNPFGLGPSVSSGVVTGSERSSGAWSSGARAPFIQTDVPTGPVESGGALIDAKGRLIGINTYVGARPDGPNAIGLAIPANLVAAVLAQARAGRDSVGQPRAGLSGLPVTRDIAERLGMGIAEGVVITALAPESPFARGGFETGDVITAVEGVPINSAAELDDRISVALEDDMMVDYLRDGDRGSVLVALRPPPIDPDPADPRPATPRPADPPRADSPRADSPPADVPRGQAELDEDTVLPGMRLVRVDRAVIADHDLLPFASGVLVVAPGRLGAQVGLQAGDVIRLINGTRVESPQMVQAALSRSGRFRLAVLRGERRIVLTFRTA